MARILKENESSTNNKEQRMKRHAHELPHFYPKIYLHPGNRHQNDHKHHNEYYDDDHHHDHHHHEHYPHFEQHEYDENGEHIEFGSGPDEHHENNHDFHHHDMHRDEDHDYDSGHHPHHEHHEYYQMENEHHRPMHHHEHSGEDMHHSFDDHSMHGEGEMSDMDVGGGYFQLDEKGGDINIVSLKRTGTKLSMGGGSFNVIRDPWRQHSLFAGLFHPQEQLSKFPIDQLHQHFTYINNDRQENHNIHEYGPVLHRSNFANKIESEQEEKPYNRELKRQRNRNRHHHRRRGTVYEKLLRRLVGRYVGGSEVQNIAERHNDIPGEDIDNNTNDHVENFDGSGEENQNEVKDFYPRQNKPDPPGLLKVMEIPLRPIVVKRFVIPQTNNKPSK